MTTNTRSNSSDFRIRLIALLVALAVGFAMGWLNGRGSTVTSDAGIVADQQQASESTTDADANETAASADDLTQDEATTASDATGGSDDSGSSTVAPTRGPTVSEDGWYTSKDEVALYIHTYGRLPGNFISKTKARARGWVNTQGNLDEVCPGMSIGGSEFYNDEGKLPSKQGRRWTECDINYEGGYRGAERIVFSNDGLVYYTGDHYQTFERLY